MKIKKKIFMILLIMLIILFILPLIFIKISKPHEFMGIMILFLFIINPISTIIINLIVGKDIKKLWYIPILFSFLFLLSYWFILKEIILDLMFYAIIYLIINLLFMFISFLINEKRKVKE